MPRLFCGANASPYWRCGSASKLKARCRRQASVVYASMALSNDCCRQLERTSVYGLPLVCKHSALRHEVRLLTYIRPIVEASSLRCVAMMGYSRASSQSLFRASRIWKYTDSTGAGSTCLPSFGLLCNRELNSSCINLRARLADRAYPLAAISSGW